MTFFDVSRGLMVLHTYALVKWAVRKYGTLRERMTYSLPVNDVFALSEQVILDFYSNQRMNMQMSKRRNINTILSFF